MSKSLIAIPVVRQIKRTSQTVSDRVCFFHLTLPDYHHLPSHRHKLRYLAAVSLRSGGELFRPERCSGLRHCRSSAPFVPVPKTAVDEGGNTMSRKDQVRLTRQITTVKTKAKAKPVRYAANRQLRGRVRCRNPAHVEASFLWGQMIYHTYTSRPAAQTSPPCSSVNNSSKKVKRWL